MTKPIYKVKETPCFPKSWKVYPLPPFREDNATCNFFETEDLAQKEADKRNT
jgi:hypothetical protein